MRERESERERGRDRDRERETETETERVRGMHQGAHSAAAHPTAGAMPTGKRPSGFIESQNRRIAEARSAAHFAESPDREARPHDSARFDQPRRPLAAGPEPGGPAVEPRARPGRAGRGSRAVEFTRGRGPRARAAPGSGAAGHSSATTRDPPAGRREGRGSETRRRGGSLARDTEQPSPGYPSPGYTGGSPARDADQHRARPEPRLSGPWLSESRLSGPRCCARCGSASGTASAPSP